MRAAPIELLRRDDPDNYAEEAATPSTSRRKLHYDPLISHDAAQWYVREAAGCATPTTRPRGGASARAAAEAGRRRRRSGAPGAGRAKPTRRSTRPRAPDDVDALLEQVDADVRAYLLTGDARIARWRCLRAAAAGVPDRRSSPTIRGKPLWALAQARACRRERLQRHRSRRPRSRCTRTGGGQEHAGDRPRPLAPGAISSSRRRPTSTSARRSSRRSASQRAHAHRQVPRRGLGRPDDEGHAVGGRCARGLAAPVSARLRAPAPLLQTYRTLERMDSPEARKAEADVRRTLTVDTTRLAEARSLLTPG